MRLPSALLALSLCPLAAHAAVGELNCRTASQIARFGLESHLITREMSPELGRRTTSLFIESALSFKGILSQVYIDAIKSEQKIVDAGQIGEALLLGDCTFFETESVLLFNAYHELAEKFPSTQALARELLAAQSAKAAADQDDSKLPPPVNVDELRLRIVRNLSRQAATWNEDAMPDAAARFVARIYLASLAKLGASLSGHWTYSAMLKALMLSLDPHSVYHSPEEAETFLSSLMASSFTGVGVEISTQATPHGSRVNGVVAGGAAESSGQVKVGEYIQAIDGKSVIGMPIDDVIELVKGVEGSSIELTLARVEARQAVGEHTVKLVRRKVNQSSSRIHVTRAVLGGKNVVTIALDLFYRGSASNVRDAVEREKARGPIDALVLDLRGNPGGSLDDARDLAGIFIKTGPVVGVRYRDSTEVLRDNDAYIGYEGPLVVAINNTSASASEIVAGTLKDLGRAVIVGGVHTFGKGTVQVIPNNADAVPAGALAITVAQFYTAGGASTQMSGVTSDVVVPGPSVSDDLLEKGRPFAIAASKVEPIAKKSELFEPDQRASGVLLELARRSRERMSKLEGDVSSASQLAEIQLLAADFAKLAPKKKAGRRAN